MSYIHIYLHPEDTKDKLLLTTYNSKTLIFELLSKLAPIAFNDDCYKILTIKDMDNLIAELNSDKDKWGTKIAEYSKYAHKNTELIEEILEMKKILESLKSQLEFCYTLKHIIIDTGNSDFKYVSINME